MNSVYIYTNLLPAVLGAFHSYIICYIELIQFTYKYKLVENCVHTKPRDHRAPIVLKRNEMKK